MRVKLRPKPVLVVVLALAAGACGGGDVSRAEYDQKVAELALAQQDLVEARERVSELEAAASAGDDVLAEVEEAVLAEVEEAVLAALGLTGIVADPGRDRIELLAEAVAATTEERDMLLAAVEAGTGIEGGAGIDLERFEGFVQIATTTQDWARPSARPTTASELEAIRPTVDLVDDEMLTLAFEQLVADYDTVSDAEQIDLLMAVAYWAVDMARAEAMR